VAVVLVTAVVVVVEDLGQAPAFLFLADTQLL
jgi:hypothetical protein